MASKNQTEETARYKFPTSIPDDVLRLSRRYQHTRASDPHYHFAINILPNWSAVDVPAEIPTPSGSIASLALFRTLDEPRAEIEVAAALVNREFNPGDWLDIYLETRGELLLHRRDTETQGGIVSDVLTSSDSQEEMLISRWLAIKDGGVGGARIFVIQVRSVASRYAKHADAFLLAISSFGLLHPGEWPLAEALLTYTQASPGDFLIAYPESWLLRRDESSNPHALVLELSNIADGTVFGRIIFTCISSLKIKEANQLLEDYLQDLAKAGFHIPVLPLMETKPFGGLEQAWKTSGQGVRQESDELPEIDIEFRVHVGRRETIWYLLAMVGVTRKSLPGMWAINNRAYALVKNHMRTSKVKGK